MRKPKAAWNSAASDQARDGVTANRPDGKSALGIVRTERVADQVYRQLRQAILQGELIPGARLRETELAERLSVSRTPVREAISRLIGDRLVQELPVGGVEVVNTRAEMEEIYAIREALEVCAVGLAAARIDDAQLGKLEELLEGAEATSYLQHDQRAVLNESFHLTIAEAARSPRLAALIADFREFFLNSAWLSQQTEEDARLALEDHRAIIEALQQGDRQSAETSLRDHLKRSYRGMGLGEPAKSRRRAAAARPKKKG